MAKNTSIDKMADEIIKGLEEYGELSTTEMKKAVRKAGTVTRREITVNAPKDTGAYAESWAVKKVKESSNSLELVVHSKNRYQLAHLLEFGHANRGGGRVPKQPHLAAAKETGDGTLEQLIKKALGG